MTWYVDGSDAVLGRLASEVASRALDGEDVVVVNAERIAVSGDPSDVADKYRARDEQKSDRGPLHPKRPEGIAKRAVRGMLPYRRERGRRAYESVRFYVGVPPEVEDEEFETAPRTVEDVGKGDYTTLDRVSESIGANVTW
ncbi:MAG: 50S ribosomal protein L13 [Halobacteriota archaeon]